MFEHLSWRFGYVRRSRFLNLASVTPGVLCSYASIIFGEFYFGESKEPHETRVIKFSRKLSILQYFIPEIKKIKFKFFVLENATLEGDKMNTSMWSNTYPHKPLRKIKVAIQSPCWQTALCGAWYMILLALLTMQASLNITKTQTLHPIRTIKHCEVLNKGTQLNGYIVGKTNLILILEICSEHWSTNRNLVTKLLTTLLRPLILLQVQIHNEYNIYTH